MKVKLLTKSLLVAAGLLVGASAWAATPTLTSSFNVAGYKSKAYYDFTTNNPAVLPEEGDLRYRSGYGLHNFGSGNRSATCSIAVNEGEILIIEEYTSDSKQPVGTGTVTIDRGSINSTTTASFTNNAYLCYDITTTAENVKFTNVRYIGIRAALVMEKDEDAALSSYTINYKDGETVVKTVSGTEAVGAVLAIESSFWKDDVKYITDAGQISTYTIVAGDNEVNINVSVAPKYSYTVNATDGKNVLEVLASGSTYSGESVTVPFPRYYNVDGTLYEKSSTDYRQTSVISSDNQVVEVAYSATNITNVVYFSEAENISGANATSAGGNMTARSSNAACGYLKADDADVTLINLAAGAYKATMVCYSNSSGGATQNFSFGDENYEASITGASNWSTFTKEFILSDAADVKWLNTSNNDSRNGLDFIYIQNTSETVEFTLGSDVSYKSFIPSQAVNFTATGVTAYVASAYADGNVTLTAVDAVPANTPVLLKGTKGESAEIIPTSETVSAPEANLLKATDAEGTAIASADKKYVLGFNAGEWKFGHFNGTLPAGKVYLDLTDVATSRPANIGINFSDNGTTGIESISASLTNTEGFYNLNGQRVAQPTKGLYIVNGKKVINK